MIITVIRIVKDTDFRAIHLYRERASRLSQGRGILYFNRQATMVRLVLWSGLMVAQWGGPGVRFDSEAVVRLMQEGGLSVRLPSKTRKKG